MRSCRVTVVWIVLALWHCARCDAWRHGLGRLPSAVSLRKGPAPPRCSSSRGDDDAMSTPTCNNTLPKISPMKVLVRFSRPHTIKGTALASVTGVARVLRDHPGHLQWVLLPRALVGLVALLCGNAYIVGINQIFDVKIDEINKPFLPLAAKQMTAPTARALVAGSLIAGLTLTCRFFSPVIFHLYCAGVVLGSLYSIPPVQLKRFPVLAAATIAAVRGFLLNFGVHYAAREALGVPFSWNPAVVFISFFMTLFASVIAVTKDLSDIEGDRRHNVTTFASRYGPKAVARVAVGILSVAYSLCIAGAGCRAYPRTLRSMPMVAGHTAALVYLWWEFLRLRPQKLSSLQAFYKSIWRLFYFEYLLYPLL